MNTQNDSQSDPQVAAPVEKVIEIDPFKVELFQQRMREEQDFARAVVIGALTALLGAMLWALVAFFSGYKTAIMAIVVGVAVGFAVSKSGKGVEPRFGWLGAAFSLAGILLGEVLAVAAFVARIEDLSIPFVLFALAMQPLELIQIMVDDFDAIDLVFYGIAVYQGYNRSFRQVTREEKEALYSERPRPQ